MMILQSQTIFFLLFCVVRSEIVNVNHEFDLTSNVTNTSVDSYNTSTLNQCIHRCVGHQSCNSAVFATSSATCYIFDVIQFMKRKSGSTSVLIHKTCPSLLQSNEDCCYYDQASCGGPLYQDCQDALEQGDIRPGETYYLRPHDGWNKTIKAVCQFDSASGWTVIQRRLDGSVDFFRFWDEYASGFGEVCGEYWIGLESIYYLTRTNTKLSVYLEAHDGESRTANYSNFYIDDATSYYKLHVTGYSGDAGDSLIIAHNNKRFSTRDIDKDSRSGSCSKIFEGAWWYHDCYASNLNGRWYPTGSMAPDGTVVAWKTYRGFKFSYKTVYMRVSR